MHPDKRRELGVDVAASVLKSEREFTSERLAQYWQEARQYTETGRYRDLKELTQDISSRLEEELGLTTEIGEEAKYAAVVAELVARSAPNDTALGGHWTEERDPGATWHSPNQTFLDEHDVKHDDGGWLGFLVARGRPVRDALPYLREKAAVLADQAQKQWALLLVASRRYEVLSMALREYVLTGPLGPATESRVAHLEAELSDLGDRFRQVNHQLENAHASVKKLRDQKKSLERRSRELSVPELQSLIDECRKGSENVNYTKLAKKLGVSDKTAKKRVKDAGLSAYAHPNR